MKKVPLKWGLLLATDQIGSANKKDSFVINISNDGLAKVRSESAMNTTPNK